MVFNSLDFLIFLPIVLLLHYFVPTKYRWIPLLAASYYFYMYWDSKLIVLILFTTVVSYLSAILIEKTDKKSLKCFYLWATLVTSLGVLVFFKYYNFLANSVSGVGSWFGADFDITLDLILPVGISFYTFQTLSYVIDVYRGDLPAEPHFGYYALFVSFFPQLVAGPIERPSNLLPQLKEEHKFNRDEFIRGFGIALVGFFKKMVIADIIAGYVNTVYNNASEATGLGVLVATVLFAVQIYCDFSGYTDIAIGCARMMGMGLMQNFNRPYIAESIKEFWARWHISLSTWFRDYLYIPLGGNRRGKLRKHINVMIVFLVSGLWHGAAWTFVIWGALHGIYQVIGEVTKGPKAKLWERLGVKTDTKLFRLGKRAVTFALVCFAWIFFRANSISDLGILIAKLFTDWGAGFDYIKTSFSGMGLDLVMILAIVLSVYLLTRFDRRSADDIFALDTDGNAVTSTVGFAQIVWMIIAAALVISAGDGESTFIYFQF